MEVRIMTRSVLCNFNAIAWFWWIIARIQDNQMGTKYAMNMLSDKKVIQEMHRKVLNKLVS